MPDKETIERAKKDAAEGKAPSTQAGEFVREEIHHIREGKHGARSPQQAVAIGLSKARRSGVKLPAPGSRKSSARTRRQAKRDLAKGRKSARPSTRRSRAVRGALKRQPRSSASRRVEAEHFARQVAKALEDGLNKKSYESLVLVTPPAFLGLLRSVLNERVLERVSATIEKDYLHLDQTDLRERLRDQLAAP